ncbi:unnamed protein product [Mycena citricolor]|uniref:Uncharacterized protein n=1 Tax=Mycena citricolor TaxID=2018698 RepID=A0AAD2GRB8_9AGAR|nr:unnamed protein product [Mycena citricolor]
MTCTTDSVSLGDRYWSYLHCAVLSATQSTWLRLPGLYSTTFRNAAVCVGHEHMKILNRILPSSKRLQIISATKYRVEDLDCILV